MLPETVFVVVTCMDRLEFLKRTAPTVLENTRFRYCLVDYSCPEKSGQWMRDLENGLDQRRITIESVPGRKVFNKSAAQNAGAKRALALGAEYLCFADADTRFLEGSGPWLEEHLRPRSFVIAGLRAGMDVPDLFGFLAVSTEAYRQSNGFDEAFQGWGAEDTEFRHRLLLRHGCRPIDIPENLLGPLTHSTDLRTTHYDEKDWEKSSEQNEKILNDKIAYWSMTTLLADLNAPDRADPPTLEDLERVRYHGDWNPFTRCAGKPSAVCE